MKKNKKIYTNNKKVIIIVTIIILLVILTAGITYAYYNLNIIGNTNEQSVNLTSDKLEIIYDTEENNDVVTGSVGETENVDSYNKTFTIKSTAKETGKYTIILDNIENNFEKTWDWTYKLYKIEENGELVESGEKNSIAEGVIGKELKRQVIRAEEEIEAGKTNKYKLEVTYDSTKPDGKVLEAKEDEGTGEITWEEEQPQIETGSNLKFRINIMEVNGNIFKEDAEKGTLLYVIGENNSVVNTLTTPGKESSKIDEAILSYTKDDYGTSYYYRGNVENNYVTFNNMCWRIVRVLGNGDIKLVLRSEAPCNELTNSTTLTNKDTLLNTYTSFSYMDIGVDSVKYINSNPMTMVNNWFETNFQNYIDDITVVISEWCQDMSVSSIVEDSETRLGGYARLYESRPNLSCRFPSTVKDYESELVKYKVALLTMDEWLFAGIKGNQRGDNSGFLYEGMKGKYFWTLTPICVGNCQGQNGKGPTVGDVVYQSAYVPLLPVENDRNDYARPSIVLSKDVKVLSGATGELNDSYVIE